MSQGNNADYRLCILPRLVRLRDAPSYLGMDRNRFNKEVRPQLIEIPIGTQGVGFDRLDLDAWVDQYKVSNGRPGKGGQRIWDAKDRQGSTNVEIAGTSINALPESEFAALLEKKALKKRSSF